MEDLPAMMERDFGLRQHGRSAPMAAARPRSAARSPPSDTSSIAFNRSRSSHSSASESLFSDVFGGGGRRSDARNSASPLDPLHEGLGESIPVYDKPRYDDDIFDGIMGVKNPPSSAAAGFDDVFASVSSSGGGVRSSPTVDDVFESFGKESLQSKGSWRGMAEERRAPVLPGFEGGGGFHEPKSFSRKPSEASLQSSTASSRSFFGMNEDPFVVLETTPTSKNLYSVEFSDPLEQFSKPVNSGTLQNNASSAGGGLFDGIDGLVKSVPSAEVNEGSRGKSSRNDGHDKAVGDPFADLELPRKSSAAAKNHKIDNNHEPNKSRFPNPSKTAHHLDGIGGASFPSRDGHSMPQENKATADIYSMPNTGMEETEDVWLSISEINLFTQPTVGPPPSRPAPPLVTKSGHLRRDEAYKEEFKKTSTAMASEAAMEDIVSQDAGYKDQEKLNHAQEQMEFERLNREREHKEREVNEREEKRREEQERERERVRIAVEMATREARERAAVEARLKAERAAVERANAEARQRAERLAVQKAAAETRERAQAEARERVERATAAKAAGEAKEKVARERAAAERVAQEARKRAESAAVERAAQESRERTAAAARERQQKYESENDLESFFGMGSRANSAPKQRAASSENMFNVQGQNRGTYDMKRPSSVSAIDDLTDLFGASSSANEFQEIEGESEERRKSRLHREQRTRERAAKALAEKNERDMQTMREQEERHRLAEGLDAEIKRWAAGKEGNMRALLSTLQYILWPELGWDPVSLTDLIIPAAVKAKYRKATLCVHPDKVQQKGATLQQKYIAEKVFDILKEAWNKFNSEELF